MAQINEEMIRRVFEEMLKHKASLSKLVVDEDEDEDISDYRVLADQIIKNFPWPIGVELRRLFSGSMRQLDRMRLQIVLFSQIRWRVFPNVMVEQGHGHNERKVALTILLDNFKELSFFVGGQQLLQEPPAEG